MEDNKPGSPPPDTSSIKPKPISGDRPEFSFYDLDLIDCFTVDNRKYLRFFVNVKTPYYIDIQFYEYIEYFNKYTDLIEQANDNNSCSCDRTIPEYEYDGITVTLVNIIVEENKEPVETTTQLKVYYVWNLLENLVVGTNCETHLKLKNDK